MLNMELSVVIPALNEKESLPQLFEEISSVCKEHSIEYEIIVVDDGSTDGTFQWLGEQAEKNHCIQGVRFRYNCGKAAALSVGFSLARGDYVVTMDGDLQDNPSEIPYLLEMLKEGTDMVSGWKKKRHDPLHKTLPSRLFNTLTRLISGVKINDFNCGLKAYRSQVVKSLSLYGHLHRYIPLIAHWNGFTVREKEVAHRPRKYGRSKYGWSRASGLFDLATLLFLHRYTTRPLHLFGLIGFCFSIFGIAVLFYFAGVWMSTGALSMRPMLLGGIAAILLGFQIVSLGLLGEMITQQAKRRYPISATTSGVDKGSLA
jgi:glycosyltransferase involved in cell wall biosynthesis